MVRFAADVTQRPSSNGEGRLVHTVQRIRRRRRLRSIFIVASMCAGAIATAAGQRPKRSGARQNRSGVVTSLSPAAAASRFTPADGGRTMHDNLLKVTWLLDANVGASQCKHVDSVGAGGGMNWKTAWACIAQLNSGKGLLGHANWQMPATPKSDSTCGARGPHQNSFGENCRGSSYGSLFYVAWKRQYGQTVALETGATKDGFRNLQPALYWYGNKTKAPDTTKKADNGYNSFSFASGWQGANVDHHAMYVMPMIAGAVPADSPVAKATIWDPAGKSGVAGKTGISWLADANIAGNAQFRQQVKAANLSINADGSMDQKTAKQLIDSMNANKYLGRDDWMLPLAFTTNCEIVGKTGTTGGYDCNVSGMGHLYYDVFKLSAGSAVDEPSDIAEVNPFTHVQPSLYWACLAATPTPMNGQAGNLCGASSIAAPGFGFSFDMGNGFTDTTLLPSDLYLMVYYPDPPAAKCATPAQCCMQAGGTMSGGKCR